jgi:hypothetical protein
MALLLSEYGAQVLGGWSVNCQSRYKARVIFKGSVFMASNTLKLAFIVTSTLLLASCGGTKSTLAEAEKSADNQAAADGKIECALAGKPDFNRVCSTERVTGPEGQLLVIRNPDGGFRRFKILGGGKGLEPADGFDDNFKIKLNGTEMIEVASGDDLYRLPAAIKPTDKPVAGGAEAPSSKVDSPKAVE